MDYILSKRAHIRVVGSKRELDDVHFSVLNLERVPLCQRALMTTRNALSFSLTHRHEAWSPPHGSACSPLKQIKNCEPLKEAKLVRESRESCDRERTGSKKKTQQKKENLLTIYLFSAAARRDCVESATARSLNRVALHKSLEKLRSPECSE